MHEPIPDQTAVSVAMTDAQRYTEAGRWADACALYLRWLDRCPEADAWIAAGQLSDAMGQHELAFKRLHRATEIGNSAQREQAFAALAMNDMHAGRFAIAGRYWWRIIRSKNNSDGPVQAWAGLVSCAIAHGNLRLSKKLIRNWKTHSSTSERRQAITQMHLHVAMGTIIRQATTSIHDDQTVAPHPTNANIALLPTDLTDLMNQSITILRQHAEQHPNRADTHYHLAMCEKVLGLSEAAQHHVDHAIHINPVYRSAVKLQQDLAA